jgi:hypothetical protein
MNKCLLVIKGQTSEALGFGTSSSTSFNICLHPLFNVVPLKCLVFSLEKFVHVVETLRFVRFIVTILNLFKDQITNLRIINRIFNRNRKLYRCTVADPGVRNTFTRFASVLIRLTLTFHVSTSTCKKSNTKYVLVSNLFKYTN